MLVGQAREACPAELQGFLELQRGLNLYRTPWCPRTAADNLRETTAPFRHNQIETSADLGVIVAFALTPRDDGKWWTWLRLRRGTLIPGHI